MKLKRNFILLIVSSVIMILIVLSVLQIHWANTLIIDKATNRVKQNIKSAWQTLYDQTERVQLVSQFMASSSEIAQIDKMKTNEIDSIISKKMNYWNLDVLTVIEVKDQHLKQRSDPVSNYIIENYIQKANGKNLAGIFLIPIEIISQTTEEFRKAYLIDGNLSEVLIIAAISPVESSKNSRYMLSGIILNSSFDILNTIQNNLFQDEFYENKRFGTVTLFAGPIRVATTVLMNNGEKAIGTRVSEEVEKQVLQNGTPWTGRARVVDSWYLSRYEPIIDPLGNIVGMLYIGELEKLYVDQKYKTLFAGISAILAIIILASLIGILMIFQNRRMEKEKRMVRFDFIRVLGHELKAPLNAVESYLYLFSNQTLGVISERYIDISKKSIDRLVTMRKLIADLLDLTRIESGQKQRELKNINICDIAIRSIEMLTPSAQEKNIDLKFNSPDSIEMIADRTELEMIFNNLISNAIKYNKDNGIVEVSIKKENSGLNIIVEDTGIGMTEPEVGRLFKDFIRIKNDKTRNIPGSGLGLSIVKKLVDMYHGEIIVKSEPEKGTCFNLTFSIKGDIL